jgi:8-oxo-dGTP pyrophosphatase MutT (NUDIX family)
MAPFPSTVVAALLDIDTHPIPARAARSESAHRHHDFAYLAIAPRAFVPTPQVEEVHDVQWIPLDALTAYPNARLRRLATKATAAIAAFSAGRPAA